MVEIVLRVVAWQGLVLYLSSLWNVLDMVVLIIGFAGSIFASPAVASLKAFRVAKTLRPLRAVWRVKPLRSVLISFLDSIPWLLSVVSVLVFFTFMFAIAGLQLFGKVYH